MDWYKKIEKRVKGWSDDLLMQWSSTKRGKWKAGGQIADRNSELSSTVQLNPTQLPQYQGAWQIGTSFQKLMSVLSQWLVHSSVLTSTTSASTQQDSSQGPRSMGQNQRAGAIDHLF